MVSKKGGKVQQQGLVSAGREGGLKASGCQAGRRRAERERGCRSKLSRRLERLGLEGLGREAPAQSSAAMCHQPCGHSATGEPVRSRLLPAPPGPPATTWGAARLHPPQLQLLRPMAPPVPEPAAAGRTGTLGWLQSRHHRASTPPQLGWQQLALTKGIRFSPVARLPRHQPLVLTAEAEAGGWRCCRVHDATRSSTLQLLSLCLLTLPPPPPPPPPLATKDQTGSPCISNH